MIDHSMRSVCVGNRYYRTNGINLVRLDGVMIPHSSITFNRVIEAFKRLTKEENIATIYSQATEQNDVET